ncbi:hypothetical protein BX661DRAFT_8629 [Kickxella alabastrina]|uniref:uncharacterized protein n=1 Tax=Kickxella alabastrina TaxID=61397 RepID=UPI0022210BF7|nr:uncharacterized protein BX661DRAFT_8629 [Kickxella alabastrina]KAI7834934.1 hypothetical protein BX661DRAFT_8629 [Kickxella alabastrina]
MNSEYSTPTLSQQHSPMLMNIQYAQQQQQQQMASGTSEISIVAPFNLAHSQMDINTPTTAVDINSAHFAYLKDAFPARPFSPSTMDFASMNIASGYHTPLPATPVALTHQQSQQIQQSQQQVAQPNTPPQSDVSSNVSGNAAPSPSVNASDSAPSEATLTTDSATILSSDKPDFSYASLIAQSLEDAPLQRRTLNGIYEWIQENFPYYRTRQNWQVSIYYLCDQLVVPPPLCLLSNACLEDHCAYYSLSLPLHALPNGFEHGARRTCAPLADLRFMYMPARHAVS